MIKTGNRLFLSEEKSMRYMNIKKIVFIIVIALCLSGCSKSGTPSGGTSGVSGSGDGGYNGGPDGEGGGDNRSSTIGLSGYVDSGENALDKDTKEMMNFSHGYDSLSMRLENNGEEPIMLTEAYIEVTDYRPLEEDGYVLYRMGDGDTFDSILALHAMVDSYTASYPAAQVVVDESGDIDYESVKKDGGDSVPHMEIDASNGKNIICRVDFLKPGIYTYKLCIKFLYENGGEGYVSSDEIISLYDADPDSIDRADEEFYENEDYYIQFI